MTVYCFLELAVGLAVVPGKIIIELFDAQVPKVVENFRVLCTGERGGPKYQGTTFHRIVETFTLQGGDTDKTGTGGSHVYGTEDDPFAGDDMYWRNIDEDMLVCMAEIPPRSQFFITLRPSPHLNGSYCCFGKVIRGQQILQQISQLEVDDNDCPVESVTIARCGELEYKGPQASVRAVVPETAQAAKTPEVVVASDHKARSRERRSPSSSSQGCHRRQRSAGHGHKQNPTRRGSRSPQRDDHRRRSERHDDWKFHKNNRPRHRQYYDGESEQNARSDLKTDCNGEALPEVIYKGRGKMLYQGQSKGNNRSGRLN